MAATARTVRLSVLALALLSGAGAVLAAQQLLAALYLLQAEHYLQPSHFALAQASLRQAGELALGQTTTQVAKARLFQAEAENQTGLDAWRARRQALRALESALQTRPGWGQGWAHLALLRLHLGDTVVAHTAWRLGTQLAPHEGLALPALCRVARQLHVPDARLWHELNCR